MWRSSAWMPETCSKNSIQAMRGSKLATSADQLRCFSNFNCCVVLPGTLFFPGKITGKHEPQS
jgi:hypothetical protein